MRRYYSAARTIDRKVELQSCRPASKIVKDRICEGIGVNAARFASMSGDIFDGPSLKFVLESRDHINTDSEKF